MSWELNSLDNVITFQRGYDLPKNDFKAGDFPVVGSTGIIGYHNEYKVKSPCVVTGRSGTLGVFQFINEDFWAHNTTLWVKDFQENDPKFIYYLLQTLDFKSLNGGVAVPTLNRNVLKNVFISYPKSLQTQKRIASILSAYDDLIENNHKRIKLLEETAQNIYKEWFVNFRFPNYENTPINQETGLPEGWEVKTISQFGTVITGKTPSTSNENFYGGNIPFVKTPDMHDAPYVIETSIYLSNEGAESQNNKFLPKNSVMVSCIGTAGVVSLTSENCQTNQQINSVKFDQEFKSFYFFCFAKGLKTLLEGLGSNGATMVNVNKSKFENIEILIPRENLLCDYHNLVNPIFNQILVLQVNNQKLKEARDILLPRLMNRTIEV